MLLFFVQSNYKSIETKTPYNAGASRKRREKVTTGGWINNVGLKWVKQSL